MKQKTIQFTKMHGLGNDVVIINAMNQPFDLSQSMISRLANRHIGIGFDQLLTIEPSQSADFFCRIYNADGSEALQCGNGLRCVARFIQEEGLHTESTFRLETKAGMYPLDIKDYDRIRISMGAPQIRDNLVELRISDDSNLIPISILSVGNPHAIVKVTSIDDSILTDKLGPQLSTHSYFPGGVNIGFMQIINHHRIRLRTFERGVGETYACGSNACAAAVVGITNGWLHHYVSVEFHYGSLLIEWDGKDQPIYMTGPASRVYTGKIELS